MRLRISASFSSNLRVGSSKTSLLILIQTSRESEMRTALSAAPKDQIPKGIGNKLYFWIGCIQTMSDILKEKRC
jgi:hypothetical protein